jgi:hypothetical protein
MNNILQILAKSGLGDLAPILIIGAIMIFKAIGKALSEKAAEKAEDMRLAEKGEKEGPRYKPIAQEDETKLRYKPIPETNRQQRSVLRPTTSKSQDLPYAPRRTAKPAPKPKQRMQAEPIQVERPKSRKAARATEPQEVIPYAKSIPETPKRTAERPKPRQTRPAHRNIARQVSAVQARKQQARQQQKPPVQTPKQATEQPRSQQSLIDSLRNKDNLKRAILYSEILGKPIALRQYRLEQDF